MVTDNLDRSQEITAGSQLSLTHLVAAAKISHRQEREGVRLCRLPSLWGSRVPGCLGGRQAAWWQGEAAGQALTYWDRATIASRAACDSLQRGHNVCTSLALASDAHLGTALDQSVDDEADPGGGLASRPIMSCLRDTYFF